MRQAIVTINGISPYSPSGYINPEQHPKKNGERSDEYEKRTWRERVHANEDGAVIIQPMAFKNALSSAASFRGEKIPGMGQKTFTKLFESGVMVTDPLTLDVKKGDVPGDWLFVPSDGKRGGGKRVPKCFARVNKWGGEVVYHVMHEGITADVFERHVETAGMFIGIGRFRPQNNGFYGRFAVEKIVWKES